MISYFHLFRSSIFISEDFRSLLALAKSLGGGGVPERSGLHPPRTCAPSPGASRIDPKFNHFFDRFSIPFSDRFGVHLGLIWEPKSTPNRPKMHLQTLSLSKTWIFTKHYKNQWILMIFDTVLEPFWIPFGLHLGAKTDPKSTQHASPNLITFKNINIHETLQK